MYLKQLLLAEIENPCSSTFDCISLFVVYGRTGNYDIYSKIHLFKLKTYFVCTPTIEFATKDILDTSIIKIILITAFSFNCGN